MEFTDVVRTRRMTRSFDRRAVEREVLYRCVDLASRAPSAGKTQGWSLLALEGADRSRFWDVVLPAERRAGFAWPGLLDAPLILVPVADPRRYLTRYSEPDKAATGLGSGTESWSVPYWTVDASFAVMTLMHALHDSGLGALFFGLFGNEDGVREAFAIPDQVQLIGALAVGHRGETAARPGRSAARPRATAAEIVNWGTLA